MVKVIGENTGYLNKQYFAHNRISKFALSTVIFISGIVAAFTYDYLSKEIQFSYKLPLFIIVFGFYFSIAWLLLLIYSKRKRQTDKYFSGITGENKVFEELKKLPDSYFLLPDISFGKGNADFIVISYKGLFIIEAKNHPGYITLSDNRLYRDGKPFEKDLLLQVRRQQQAAEEYIDLVRIATAVIPVLVFANPAAKIEANSLSSGKVTVIHVSGLLHFIQNYPAKIRVEAPELVANLFSRLKK